ncbi:hypothetical protein [Ferruginibacter sp.]|nr:hypothetical protein [Ferruginibacter sp.]
MVKYFFCAFLLAGSLFSCAQSNVIVKKVHSFYIERSAGNIAVDKNGNELQPATDTVIQVYVESFAKNIIWDTAWIGTKSYLIITQAITQGVVEAGVQKEGGKRAVIEGGKGIYVWQLYLQPLNNTADNKNKIKAKEKEILLKGKYKGMVFLQKAGKPVQLETIPSV